MSQEQEELPSCRNCTSTDWTELDERKNKNGRRRRIFKCRYCGSSAKIFDGKEKTIYSGAMRHAGVRQ